MSLKVFDKVEFIGHDDDQFGEDLHNHIGYIQKIISYNSNHSSGRNFQAYILWEKKDFELSDYSYRESDFMVIDQRVFNVGDTVIWDSCDGHYEHFQLRRKTTGIIKEICPDGVHDEDNDCFEAKIEWTGIPYYDDFLLYNPYKLILPQNTNPAAIITKATEIKQLPFPVKPYYSSEQQKYKTIFELAEEQEQERLKNG